MLELADDVAASKESATISLVQTEVNVTLFPEDIRKALFKVTYWLFFRISTPSDFQKAPSCPIFRSLESHHWNDSIVIAVM